MIALDIETTGLDPRKDKILGIAVYGDGWDNYLTLDEFKQKFGNRIRELFQPVIFHNGQFDMEFLHLNGIEIPENYHDTKLLAYLLCKPSTRLKDLGETELGEKVIRYEDVCGKGKKQVTLDKVDPKIADEYARQDAWLTHSLYTRLNLQMTPKLWDLYTKLELPLLRVLLDMRLTGIQVDLPYLRQLEKETRMEICRILKKMMPYIRHTGTPITIFPKQKILCGYYNNLEDEDEHEHLTECFEEVEGTVYYPNINLNSPKQIGELMYQQLGLPVVKKTDKGQPATDTEVLRELEGMHPFVGLLLQYRDTNKRLNTYVEPLIEQGEKDNGTIHPRFNQALTATGRLSSSSPINLQNIPKRKGTGLAIRQAFIARPGCVLIEADYSQQEVRLMANFSNDSNLIRLFNSDVDIYTALIQTLYNCSKEEAEEKRALGKLLFLALSYGAMAKKLARSAKIYYNILIDEEEMQELLDKCKSIFSVYFSWRDEVLKKVRKQGYTETILGRRRYFPKINSPDKWERYAQEREAVNSVIQGSGADITKMAIVKLHNAGYKLLLTVHDSVLIELQDIRVTDQELSDPLWEERHKEQIKSIMEHVIKLKVPLKVDIHTSKRWGGDLKEVKI